MHASLNVGYQGKSGPGKIHEVILVNSKILKGQKSTSARTKVRKIPSFYDKYIRPVKYQTLDIL